MPTPTTLVIIIGTMRGGPRAWQTLIDRVLIPLKARLALAVRRDAQLDEFKALFGRDVPGGVADWSFEDSADWGVELDKVCDRCAVERGSWKTTARQSASEGMWGGALVDGAPLRGSGAVLYCLRERLLVTHIDDILCYDYTIVTRSDHFYLAVHPVPRSLFCDARPTVCAPFGEDYHGVTDRHHVVDRRSVELYLCVARYLVQNHTDVVKRIVDHPNPEQVFSLYFDAVGLHVARFQRCMVTVARPGEETRWKGGSSVALPCDDSLLLKYPVEYYTHVPRTLRALRRGDCAGGGGGGDGDGGGGEDECIAGARTGQHRPGVGNAAAVASLFLRRRVSVLTNFERRLAK